MTTHLANLFDVGTDNTSKGTIGEILTDAELEVLAEAQPCHCQCAIMLTLMTTHLANLFDDGPLHLTANTSQDTIGEILTDAELEVLAEAQPCHCQCHQEYEKYRSNISGVPLKY
jgi:oligoribonuclease (3'-5' exoribonuclease)